MIGKCSPVLVGPLEGRVLSWSTSGGASAGDWVRRFGEGQPSGDGFQVRRQQRAFCSEIGLVECGCAGGLTIHTEGKVLQEGEG